MPDTHGHVSYNTLLLALAVTKIDIDVWNLWTTGWLTYFTSKGTEILFRSGYNSQVGVLAFSADDVLARNVAH